MEKIKEYKEPSNKIEKTLTYLGNYGLKKTVVKVANKLRGRDQEHFAYGEFLKNHPLTQEMLEDFKKEAESFEFKPLVSIVIPLYNTPEKFLIELVESIEAQVYDRWQLCLADGSPKEGLYDIICKAKGAEGDDRISYSFLGKNEGIAGNTNAAIDLAQGDYIAFCDHDDLLRADALYQVVKAFNEDRSIDFVYTDEDKIDMEGKTFFLPHFKSDFNLDLLRSHNYITHFVVCKAALIKELKVKSDYDGAQDHDMLLRVVERCTNIVHIPEAVYHWRCHEASTAAAPEAKMYAFDSGRRAVEDHLKRCGIPAHVILDTHLGYYRTCYDWEGEPLVSIVIPNKDHADDLMACIDSIAEKNSYKNIEFIIVENNSSSPDIHSVYRQLSERSDIKV
ncbi:MAG: glycosyltransferase, partial [Pseudobutyrivibrio sp.]|nr:glycosyltransferase [Pseudobutyrivibrio sp.]MCF0185442.1 glycosyltransferase [Bacteroidaceae bacterium]